jgi:hypothetical protein
VIISYLYELFDEDKEPGASSARNFGLFDAAMSPVYAVDLTGTGLTLEAPASTQAVNRTWCIAKQVRNLFSIDDACLANPIFISYLSSHAWNWV